MLNRESRFHPRPELCDSSLIGDDVEIGIFCRGSVQTGGREIYLVIRALDCPGEVFIRGKWIGTVQQGAARFCRLFEEKIVVGMLVGYPTRFTRWSGDLLRGLQQGRLTFYAYCFVGGITLIVLLFMFYPWGGR